MAVIEDFEHFFLRVSERSRFCHVVRAVVRSHVLCSIPADNNTKVDTLGRRVRNELAAFLLHLGQCALGWGTICILDFSFDTVIERGS